MSGPRTTRRQFSLSSYYSLLECMHKKEIGWQRRKTLAQPTPRMKTGAAARGLPTRTIGPKILLTAWMLAEYPPSPLGARSAGGGRGPGSVLPAAHGDVEQAVEEHKG